ncbi:MAG: hypothetical protein ACJA09_000641 [Alcanivorax sp.]|jgi:hypothetical protein
MMTGKHIIAALLITPVLAILAWFAMDQLVAERARPALPGSSYLLVEQSNCRYSSGRCELANGDFKLILAMDEGELLLASSHALDGALLSINSPELNLPPVTMNATDENKLHWRISLARTPRASERIRVAVRADGSAYFGEASITWMAAELTR